jgi:hypothetical protein
MAGFPKKAIDIRGAVCNRGGMKPMTPMQTATFWVWFKSYNGGKSRSCERTAALVGVSRGTVEKWRDDFEWEKIAAEKDAELGHTIERVVVRDIIRTYEEALERQRKIVSALYDRFMAIIPDLPADQIKVSDLIRLMEFETQYVFDEDRGQPKGNLLGVVLGMMPPEERAKFHGAIERARDSGRLQLAPVGSPSRN